MVRRCVGMSVLLVSEGRSLPHSDACIALPGPEAAWERGSVVDCAAAVSGLCRRLSATVRLFASDEFFDKGTAALRLLDIQQYHQRLLNESSAGFQ